MVQVGHDPAAQDGLYPGEKPGEAPVHAALSECVDVAQDVGVDVPERRSAEAGRDEIALRLD